MRWDPLHDLVAWHTHTHARVPDASGWTPPVDVYETPDSYTVIVELAGFSSDQFALHAQDDALIITGERAPEGGSGQFLHIERGHGAFSRRFKFPQQIAVRDVKADFKDGLLTVTVPKLARPGPRRVEISS
jgi:HSP20 family protein